jgi:hypothetical protein
VTTVRVATFNIENFDETKPSERPSLAERIALMQPQIVRLRTDIVCFQEINGQGPQGQPQQLLALPQLLAGTNLANATLASTKTQQGGAHDERNLCGGNDLTRSPARSSCATTWSRRRCTSG